MKLKDYITEYVSSGRGANKKTTPNKDIDSIVNWLKYLGVTEFKKWDGSITSPPTNGIIAEIGPCRPGKSEISTHWVSLHNHPSCTNRTQYIVARLYVKSQIEYSIYDKEEINFEDAIEYMREMVSDPKKPVERK